MIHAFIRYGDGSVCTTCDHETLSRAKADEAARCWIDLDQPDDDERKLLSDVFHFHPLAIEDASSDHAQRAKIEDYQRAGDIEQHKSGYYFIVVHAPDLDLEERLSTASNRAADARTRGGNGDGNEYRLATKELDIFLGERFLVTLHRQRLRAINSIVARFKKDPAAALDEGLDVLLHSMLDKIVDAYFPILDKLQARIDRVEDQATASPQRVVLKRINRMKRELLNYRRTIAPQRDVLNSLTRGEVPFIRETARVYLRDVQDHLNRVVETVELYRDLIAGARDLYLSSISNNLNQVMKTLTIITVVTLPLTVVTSFFGMNFDAIPAIHSRRGFWFAVVFMLMAVGGLLAMFKRKKWI